MSLLMDALKRAEEAKRQSGAAGPEASANGRELSLEPQGGSDSPLPDLNSHLAALDADLQAEANAPSPPLPSHGKPPAGTPVSAAKERQAAKNVFAAKQPPPAATPGGKRTLALAIGGGVAALGIVGYFGYQYLTLTGAIPRTPTAALAQAPGTPTAPRTGATAARGALRPLGDASSSLADQPDSPAAQSPASPSTAGGARDSARRPRQLAPGAPSPRQGPAMDAGSAGETGVRVVTRTPQLPAGLASAYAALQSGRLAEAQAAYTRVLQDDPRNEDALLGLAAIAARQGQQDRAEGLYLRLLELDPKNAAAHAGLAGIGNYGDPAQRESRLKTLLANPPADGAVTGMLHFALGNLYAEQRRWNEAQQAYFQAVTGDDGNPDYLYNLAVSLDHLRQPRLAAQYYEAALAAAGKRSAAFNPQQAQARLATLPR